MSAQPQDLAKLAVLEKNSMEILATLKRIEKMLINSAQEDLHQVEKGNDDDDGEDDDEIDLFGDDDSAKKPETVEPLKQKVVEKPQIVAKSTIVLDVKPWDDETDMEEVERCVRSVAADGLLWGTSKLVEVGYGIKKLQIGCVVEDEKVGTDMLEDEITKFEDFVQSVDVACFNKL